MLWTCVSTIRKYDHSLLVTRHVKLNVSSSLYLCFVRLYLDGGRLSIIEIHESHRNIDVKEIHKSVTILADIKRRLRKSVWNIYLTSTRPSILWPILFVSCGEGIVGSSGVNSVALHDQLTNNNNEKHSLKEKYMTADAAIFTDVKEPETLITGNVKME